MRRILMISFLLLASTAWASMSLDVDAIEVNGLEVRHLTCHLEKGGFFAVVDVVGTLAQQKAALDACAPAGAAVLTRWTWSAGDRVASVESGVTPEQGTCMAQALGKVQTELAGTCSAVLLVGDAAAARLAADVVAPEPPAPAIE